MILMENITGRNYTEKQIQTYGHLRIYVFLGLFICNIHMSVHH